MELTGPTARIVVQRYDTAQGEHVQVEECWGGPDGMPLSLSEALGLLRQAGDTLSGAHYRRVLEEIRRHMLGDVTDEWDAERDATIIALITETLDTSPNAA